LFGRSRRRWEDNKKIGSKNIGLEDGKLMEMTQDNCRDINGAACSCSTIRDLLVQYQYGNTVHQGSGTVARISTRNMIGTQSASHSTVKVNLSRVHQVMQTYGGVEV
jgi:hypothetical protein